jgi:hypothetical protein
LYIGFANDNFGTLHGHQVFLVSYLYIWHFLWPLGVFFPICFFCQEKSGNRVADPEVSQIWRASLQTVNIKYISTLGHSFLALSLQTSICSLGNKPFQCYLDFFAFL